MRKIEKLKVYSGQDHEFIPSDAREICQYCGDYEEDHRKVQQIFIDKINEIIDYLASLNKR